MTPLQIVSLLVCLAAFLGVVNHVLLRLPSAIGLVITGLVATLATIGLDEIFPALTIEETVRRLALDRFIPACAGNTAGPRRPPRHRPVHPRLRGEHNPNASRRLREFGSSPPARGTLHRGRQPMAQRRFIPACAGNTDELDQFEGAPSVHPRLRGEHTPSASAP